MTSRRVTVRTPLGEALQFQRLIGTEELSRPYVFELDLLAASNAIDPKTLLGMNTTLAIQTESGGVQYLGGIVTRFGLSRDDGRRSFYKMRLRPWLWLTTRRSDYRIFQDSTVPEVIAAVLAPYGYPVEQKLSREYRRWPYCCQYGGETDFAFVSRLAEHEGLYYWIRHEAEQHVLIFADDIDTSHGPLPGGKTLRHHVPQHAGKTDGLHASERIWEWTMSEELRSGLHYTDDYDPGKPRADLSSRRRMPAGHAHDSFEQYEWPGGYAQLTDGETCARIRTEEQLGERIHACGVSNRRDLAPGYIFELAGHPRTDQNQDYLLVSVAYQLQENLRTSEGRDCDGGGCIQRFAVKALPVGQPWRPARTTPKPRTNGPQTAIVVGPQGEDMWVDQLGRIKVQFHWDRVGHQNEHSSCWLRVSSSWAGGNFGSVALPRIGQEVIVDFLNGDPDHPIVVGRVHNADEMPAWKLPAQKQLSGIRSRELGGGGRSNHLALDDGPRKIQAQLKSDHQSSSLGLGHIGRIEDTTGRKDDRGQGFELRTDGHGALRAGRGMLLTTEPRPDARGHTTDMPETHARFTQGWALHEGLSRSAVEAKAHDEGDQAAVAEALKAQNDAIEGHGGNPAEGVFPEFEEPHLTLSSPAGIQSTAAGSTHVMSGEHTALTSGGHTSISAGKSLLTSAKDAVRLFANKAGIRLSAAKNDIDIRALKHSVNIVAKLGIKLEGERIVIAAREEVLISSGGSFSRWNASGIEHGTQGVWREHAASQILAGPRRAPLPEGYEARCDLQNSDGAGGASVSR